MTGYTFSVNSQTDVGALTWNTNGTLNQLKITDGITGTTDSQTCNYLYDDLQRLSSSNCGAIWTQNFTYDAFGNIIKTGNSQFIPGYSPTQNQFTSIPGRNVSYDGDGNLLTDNLNTYTWDVYGRMSTVNTGSATVTAIYDALGRMVENNAGGSYTEFIYGPTGVKLAQVNGSTLIKAFVALPGGAKAIYNSTGLAYYRHSDWLGSSRLTSTASRAMYSSTAYAPFGEQYANNGTTDASFTGQDQDTVGSLYDFPARRQSPSQGRWISPDPLGRGAVTLANPQSWNRYAYVNNNPLQIVDPNGTTNVMPIPCDALQSGCQNGPPGTAGGGGSGGVGGGSDDSGSDDSSGGCDPLDIYCGSGIEPDENCDAECQQQQDDFWQQQQQNCQQGLQEAGQTMDAVNRALDSWDTIQSAADANNIDPALLAAVGVRETGFQNVWQSGDGNGAGIYQIDLGVNSNVTQQQAFNPSWAANYAANMLATNMSTINAAHPNFAFGSSELTQATAASYNFGTGNISGNPDTIDVGTTGGNYGSDVDLLMDCF
jgi:RHS repeat-associated protein